MAEERALSTRDPRSPECQEQVRGPQGSRAPRAPSAAAQLRSLGGRGRVLVCPERSWARASAPGGPQRLRQRLGRARSRAGQGVCVVPFPWLHGSCPPSLAWETQAGHGARRL